MENTVLDKCLGGRAVRNLVVELVLEHVLLQLSYGTMSAVHSSCVRVVRGYGKLPRPESKSICLSAAHRLMSQTGADSIAHSFLPALTSM